MAEIYDGEDLPLYSYYAEFDDEPTEDESEDDAPETLTEWEAIGRYRDYLDEIYPVVQIGELHYSVSHALEQIDPIVFWCGFNDWIDSEGIEVE